MRNGASTKGRPRSSSEGRVEVDRPLKRIFDRNRLEWYELDDDQTVRNLLPSLHSFIEAALKSSEAGVFVAPDFDRFEVQGYATNRADEFAGPKLVTWSRPRAVEYLAFSANSPFLNMTKTELVEHARTHQNSNAMQLLELLRSARGALIGELVSLVKLRIRKMGGDPDSDLTALDSLIKGALSAVRVTKPKASRGGQGRAQTVINHRAICWWSVLQPMGMKEAQAARLFVDAHRMAGTLSSADSDSLQVNRIKQALRNHRVKEIG